VLTPSNPTTANSSTLSQWFQASTSGSPPGSNTPPVGTGYIPVDQDTAAFTWSANSAVAPVYSFNSANSTWTPATGQVINGNVFVTGSVNSNKLNANDVYTIKLQSTNANIGNNSSNGFWFDSTTGNARIAGNVSIGNSLTIQNNANIGNNLTIGNSVTIAGVTLNGALVANIVGNSQLQNNAVGAGKIDTGAVTAGTIAAGAVTAGTIAAGAVQANSISANTMSGNIIVANTMAGNVIIANTLNGNAIIANTISANTINANAISAGTLNTGVLYAGNIASFGATVGNISSPGYWLAYTTGDARFGGNVNIGANLNVTGLITTGGLNANTVATTTMQPQSVTDSGGISNTSLVTVATSPTAGDPYFLTDTILGITTTIANQDTFVWGTTQATVNFTGLGTGESFEFIVYLFLIDSTFSTIIDTLSAEFYTIFPTPLNTVTETVIFNGFQYTIPVPGTYYWAMAYVWNPIAGSYSVNNFQTGARSLLLQTTKR